METVYSAFKLESKRGFRTEESEVRSQKSGFGIMVKGKVKG
jgi:hypothetical protein